MQIPSFSVSTPRETIADALDEAGCVVVTGVLDESARNKVRGELSPHMQKVSVEEDNPTEFYAGLTRRTSALVARSESVGGLVADEMSTGLCDRFLSPNGEFGYHLHVSAALEVGPGARRQIAHGLCCRRPTSAACSDRPPTAHRQPSGSAPTLSLAWVACWACLDSSAPPTNRRWAP